MIERTATVTGRVLDRQGRPIPGVDAGRRLLARSRGGLVVDLRWDAPAGAKDRTGPRLRLVQHR